jgi:hypothetical protein
VSWEVAGSYPEYIDELVDVCSGSATHHARLTVDRKPKQNQVLLFLCVRSQLARRLGGEETKRKSPTLGTYAQAERRLQAKKGWR